MSERAPYSRVYWQIVDDPKFVTVYDDDHAFALWLRLLLTADQAHPASATLPVGSRRAAIATLIDARLITVTGSRFRIVGLDAERGKRTDTARIASASRWHTERTASGMPRRDETRRDETSNARESMSGDDGRADLEAFLLITRRAPTPRQRQLLDGLLDRHDLTGPAWAADIMLRHPDDPIGAVIEADKAWRAERIAEAQAQEKPKPQPRRKPAMPESTRELLAHWAGQKEAG